MINSFKYLGKNKKKNYFEGWYLKIVDSSNDLAYSMIFGITLYKDDKHAFIQVVDANTNESSYHRFDISEFDSSKEGIKIGKNILHPLYTKIDLENFKMNLNFSNAIDIKRNLLNAGTMGIYKMIPMGTYHETVFLKSDVSGFINDDKINGLAYMEKNWGETFPDNWIWIQSNHFSKQNTSFLFSYADVRINNIVKPGFFCMLNVNDREVRFATYNKSEVQIVQNNNELVELIISRKDMRLEIKLYQEEGTEVIAPIDGGLMQRTLNESIDSYLELQLYVDNTIVFEDTASYVAAENTYI